MCAGIACGGGRADPCARLGELCEGEGYSRDAATRVDDAVSVDVDGDGEPEIVALTRDASQLVLGYASGWRSLVFFTGGERPVALAGLPGEVAVAVASPSTVVIFGVDPEGRLERRRALALSGEPTALWSGDLDGDGRPELMAGIETGELAVLDPDSGQARSLAVDGTPIAIAAADLDGDSVIDLAVAVAQPWSLKLLRGAGGGEFHPASELTRASGQFLTLADHDGDGDIDVLTRWRGSQTVTVIRNQGAGVFSAPVGIPFTNVVTDEENEGSGLVAGPVVKGGLGGVSVPQGLVLSTWFGKGANWLGRVEEGLPNMATWVGGGTEAGLLVGGHGFVGRFEYQRSAAPIELWRDSSVRAGSGEIATGDLDGDHLLDFAVATRDALDIFLGDADLGFRRTATVALDGGGHRLAIAEVTGDAHADIVIADGEVRVLRGLGSGEFVGSPAYAPKIPVDAVTPLRTGANTPSAVVGFGFGSDPGTASQGGVALLRFAGDGQVAEETLLAEPLVMLAIAAVDFDADGVEEPLMFAIRDDALVLTHYTPMGPGFVAGFEHDLGVVSGVSPLAIDPSRFAAGDVDGDQVPEVMVSINGGALQISGLGENAPVATVWPDMTAPTHFRDVDADGHKDAVRVGHSGITYHRGGGDGTFEAEGHRYAFPFGGDSALASEPNAQFDLVSVSDVGVSTHLVREVVRPVEAGSPLRLHSGAHALVTGDLNRDGYDDVVTSSRFLGGGLVVLWGDESGALARGDGFNHVLNHRNVAVGDLDGDGFSEVVAALFSSWLEVYRVWPRREVIELELPGFDGIGDVVVADVDGDGLADLVVVVEYSNDTQLYIAYGRGDFTFGDKWERELTIPELGEASLEVGDVDGDGLVDLLLHATDGSANVLVLGEGERAWAGMRVLPGQQALFSPADEAGQVDLWIHDGRAISRHVDGAVGSGEVLAQADALAEVWLQRVADIDADGHDDFVVMDEAGLQAVWMHHEGGYQPVFTVDLKVMMIAGVADLDGDRRPDLVGLTAGGAVAVHLAAHGE